MTRPSDRAIAQAFWEWRTRSNYFRAKYSASIWVEERAAELDAAAAPVVVGEDMVLIGWISGKPDENSGHLVFDKQTAHANVPVYTKGVRHV